MHTDRSESVNFRKFAGLLNFGVGISLLTAAVVISDGELVREHMGALSLLIGAMILSDNNK